MTVNDAAAAKDYQRRKLWLSLIGLGLTSAYLLAWIPAVGSFIELVRTIADNRWAVLALTGVAMFGLFELIALPLSFYEGYILEHRYRLSRQSLGRWFWQTSKKWLVGGAIGATALALLYLDFWHGGKRWWLWLWMGYFLLTVVMARIFPTIILPIFYKSERIEGDSLSERLRRLAEGTGIRIEGVYRLRLGDDSRKANAMLAGIGSSRRVLLADTLLDEFTEEEVDVVFVHELGHHVFGHISLMLGLQTVLSLAWIGLLWWTIDESIASAQEDWAISIAALPVIGAVTVGMSIVVEPLLNFISRRMETQCDRYALTRIDSPEAYVRTFEKLASMNLADPQPHPLIEWFFYDHPPISKRIALASSKSPERRFDPTQIES